MKDPNREQLAFGAECRRVTCRGSLGTAMCKPEHGCRSNPGMLAGMNQGQSPIQKINRSPWGQALGFFLIQVDGKDKSGPINGWAVQDANAPDLNQPPGPADRGCPERSVAGCDIRAIIGNQS